VIADCGAIKSLVSDQGSFLIGKIMMNFCELFDIKQVKIAAYHPATNSRAEIMHKSLESLLRTSCKSQSDWVRLLPYIVIAMRSSPIRGLGHSPHEIVFGGAGMSLPIDSVYLTSFDLQNPDPVPFIKEVRTGINLISEITRENIRLNQLEMKQYFDKSVVQHSYSIGSLVWLDDPVCRPDEHPKLRCRHRRQFRITYLNSHDCRLKNPADGKIISKMVNLNRIKPVNQRDDKFFEDFSDLFCPQDGTTDLPVAVADQVKLDTLSLIDSGTDTQVQTDQGPVLVPQGTPDVLLGTPVTDLTILLEGSPSVVCPDSSLHDMNVKTDIMYPAKCILQQKGQGSTKQFRVQLENPDSAPSWVPAINVAEALTTALYKTHTKTSSTRNRRLSESDIEPSDALFSLELPMRVHNWLKANSIENDTESQSSLNDRLQIVRNAWKISL